jgi:hypothetical protein
MAHELALHYNIDYDLAFKTKNEIDYWRMLIFENIKALREQEILELNKNA